MMKLTQKDYFKMIREVVANADVENREDMIAFIDGRVAQLEKKRTSTALTDKQKENLVIADEIYNALVGMSNPVTVSELIKAEGLDLSNQKVSAIMKKLVDAGRVTKTIEKKKSYFTAVV